MARKKKQTKQLVVEKGIFSIYPDFPVLINDKVILDAEEKPLHFHYYLEIGYCFEGNGIFKSNNREYKLKQKDITVTASDILHTVHSGNENEAVKLAYLYVDFDDLIKMFPAGEAKTQLVFAKEALQDILYLEGKNHPDMLWLLDEIIHLYKEKKQSYKMQVVALLYTLLLKIYDAFTEEFRIKEKSKDLPIMPAIEYIYDHYMEPVKVSQLAKACHFSESYFRKVFLEMKGMTPIDYLNSIRIREACRMLLNSTDTVRMVGERCGYPSVTTFERNFRQRTGMLPSQWRDSQKNPRRKDKNAHEIKRTYQYEQND